MTRSFPLTAAGAALLLLVGSGPDARAGGRPQYVQGPAAVTTSEVVVPMQVPMTMAPAARSPYLGTFRPDPTLAIRNGYTSGGGYTPAGLPGSSATMSLYGPFSRLRSLPTEVVTYSRGYDGGLRPTSSGISYEYTDPRLYPDTTLIPTGMRIDPYTGARVRSGFGRYLLGQ